MCGNFWAKSQFIELELLIPYPSKPPKYFERNISNYAKDSTLILMKKGDLKNGLIVKN
jgi:hypothetical protein